MKQLLLEGDSLDLKLKEYYELSTHQKDMNDWKSMISLIFNNSKTVSLEQLDKHIKDSKDITDGANKNYIELL